MGPFPGDREAMLAVVADGITRQLPPDKPLWSATVFVITGPDNGRSALMVVFHHVSADGQGGLGILRLLAGDELTTSDSPRRARTGGQCSSTPPARGPRLSLGSQDRALGAVAELGGPAGPAAPRCSLTGRSVFAGLWSWLTRTWPMSGPRRTRRAGRSK
jgi:hypothetical protein